MADEEDIVAADAVLFGEFIALAVVQQRHRALHEAVERIVALAAPGAGRERMDRDETGAAQRVVQILVVRVSREAVQRDRQRMLFAGGVDRHIDLTQDAAALPDEVQRVDSGAFLARLHHPVFCDVFRIDIHRLPPCRFYFQMQASNDNKTHMNII